MKLTLGLRIKKADKIIQRSDPELPDLNIYLADEQGCRYIDQQGNYYILEI